MKYYIIFPRGDRTKLSVKLIEDYEVSEYAIASRKNFFYDDGGKYEAIEYAKSLAEKFNLSFVGDEHGYLD